ncbi:MAG TPA: NADH-quinone oxidoreductase subunit B family protein [Coriobacteriia bacterium]|nr:NADH-quinone oxidoreductase subunit B family protein [Coriobacteriia bacterium]
MGVDGRSGVLVAPLQKLMDWARGHSMWPMTFGTACCAIEMMTVGSARYDTDRLGIFFRNSPRQADCMIVSGTINLKMAPRMKLLYEQMSSPKYVIAMGSCAVGGGPFAAGYNVVNGVDMIIPVDIYLPGCPARPEALLHALITLYERNSAGEMSAAERYAIECAKAELAPAVSAAEASAE